jgi:hypothetical protein
MQYTATHPDLPAPPPSTSQQATVTLRHVVPKEKRRKLTIISQNPPQIWVTAEEDAIHVPDLPLVPIGSTEESGSGWDGSDLICVGLDSDTGVVGD